MIISIVLGITALGLIIAGAVSYVQSAGFEKTRAECTMVDAFELPRSKTVKYTNTLVYYFDGRSYSTTIKTERPMHERLKYTVYVNPVSPTDIRTLTQKVTAIGSIIVGVAIAIGIALSFML